MTLTTFFIFCSALTAIIYIIFAIGLFSKSIVTKLNLIIAIATLMVIEVITLFAYLLRAIT
jgi:hypothetical protein